MGSGEDGKVRRVADSYGIHCASASRVRGVQSVKTEIRTQRIKQTTELPV